MTTNDAATVFPAVYTRLQSEVWEMRSKLDRSSLEVVAKEVIQRVAERAKEIPSTDHPATAAELEALCLDLISDDQNAGLTVIAQARADGVSVETVYLSYLAGAARLLGQWWDTDRVSFFDVTAGTGRIYAIMRALNTQTTVSAGGAGPQRLALFAAVPGETHNLGVKAAADLLERRGWSVRLLVGRSHDQLIEEVVASDAGIIGLSAAGAHALPALAKLIVSLRIEAPAKKIIVGGHVLAEAEEQVCAMRPDALAVDMPQAYAALERLRRGMVPKTGEMSEN
ncbi:MAG: cobalamin B12-binding domain-containing protein [Pseudomonadota bacterium]